MSKGKPLSIATIKDVARRAEVSLGSVSRVVNGNATVSDKVRIKVEQAISELGFRPNSAARTMRSRVSKTISCIIRDIEIAGFARFVRSADEVFMRAGYSLFVSNSEGRIDRERDLLSVIVSRKVDALLIAPSTETDRGMDALLKSLQIPVVLIDREQPSWADAVMVDHRGGVRQATERLIQLGHRRIALLTGKRDLFPSRERIAGYEAAILSNGLQVDPNFLRLGSFDAAYAFEQTSMLLAMASRPTAIIAGGIEMLPGVIRALRVHNLSMPKDISIVASMNSDLADLLSPSISVEDWDYSQLGSIAANLALSRLGDSNHKEAQRIIIPSHFIMRDSCGPAPS